MRTTSKYTTLMLLSFFVVGGIKGDVAADAAKKASEAAAKEEMEGLDTISIKEPEGNWLMKRMWWDKGQKKYEKIKRTVSEIVEARMKFFKMRNEVDKNVFDPFYLDLGLKQGQLEAVVTDLLKELKKGMEKEEDLSSTEQKFLGRLKKEQTKLKQTKLDVDAIKKLDDAIDEDLMMLMEQINVSRRDEEEAWQKLKKISKEINHQKAREIYFEMDHLWSHVKNVYGYIKGKFTAHFNNIISNAKQQADRIKKAAADLKSAGIDLRQQYAKLERGVVPKPVKKKVEPVKKEVPKEEVQEEPVGWFASIFNAITWPFRKLWGAVSSLWTKK